MSVESKTQKEREFIALIANEMINTFSKKNIAYGDSFGKTFQKYGAISALTRMSDKWGRIEALMLGAKNDVVDERLEDTLKDMACYCLMTLYELHERSSGA